VSCIISVPNSRVLTVAAARSYTTNAICATGNEHEYVFEVVMFEKVKPSNARPDGNHQDERV